MDRRKEVGECTNFFVVHRNEWILSKVDRPGNSNLSILLEDVKGNYQSNQKYIMVRWCGRKLGERVNTKKKHQNPSAFIESQYCN